MAIYGAKYLRFAPKTAAGEAGAKLPTYGEAVDLGPLVSVAETITYASARNFGDNVLQESVDEFQELSLVAAMTEMPIESAAIVYGATKTATGGISYGAEDSAPEGMLAFYTTKLTKDASGVQKKFYQGVAYPNVKASRQGATYNTKGQSITFANGQANFVGSTEENGKFQIFSSNFASDAEAKAWVDKMLKGGADAYAEVVATA